MNCVEPYTLKVVKDLFLLKDIKELIPSKSRKIPISNVSPPRGNKIHNFAGINVLLRKIFIFRCQLSSMKSEELNHKRDLKTFLHAPSLILQCY